MRYAILIAGVCGVASAALLARYGLEAGLSPIQLSAWRLTIASAVLILIQVIRRGQQNASDMSSSDVGKTAIAGLFLALHFATWIGSLQYISIARSTLLVSTSPLWAGLLGLIVPSLRPRATFWYGLALAAVGTAVVATQGAAGFKSQGTGDLLAVLGAVCIVPYLLLSQQVQARVGTLRTITWIYSAAALCLIAYLGASSGIAAPTSSKAWLSIVGMAVFAQLLGHSLFNLSLRFFTAAQVTAATLLEPVFAAGLAWVFLSEPVGLAQAGGGILLLVGVGISCVQRKSATP